MLVQIDTGTQVSREQLRQTLVCNGMRRSKGCKGWKGYKGYKGCKGADELVHCTRRIQIPEQL